MDAKRAIRNYRGPDDAGPFMGLIEAMSFQLRNIKNSAKTNLQVLEKKLENGYVKVMRVGDVEYVTTRGGGVGRNYILYTDEFGDLVIFNMEGKKIKNFTPGAGYDIIGADETGFHCFFWTAYPQGTCWWYSTTYKKFNWQGKQVFSKIFMPGVACGNEGPRVAAYKNYFIHDSWEDGHYVTGDQTITLLVNGEIVQTKVFPGGTLGQFKTSPFVLYIKIYNNRIYLLMRRWHGANQWWIDCYDTNFNLLFTSGDFDFDVEYLTGSETYIAGISENNGLDPISVKTFTRDLTTVADFSVSPPPNTAIFQGPLGIVANKYYHWWAFTSINGEIPVTPYFINGEVAGAPFFLQQSFERDWPFYMGGLIAHNVVL